MQHFGIKNKKQLWAVLIFMFSKHIALSSLSTWNLHFKRWN